MAEDDTHSSEDYVWNVRQVIYTIPADEKEMRKTWATSLETYTKEIKERDMVFIDIRSDTPGIEHITLKAGERERLTRLYELEADKAAFLLIGKDGGLKERIESPDLVYLFSKIDQMPMRRAEMKADQQDFSKKVRILNKRKQVSRWLRKRR